MFIRFQIMRESAKEERIAYEEKIRKLRKGRMDLLKAYKQQIILIDNLRRQNVCLEKAKVLEIAEKEFLKVLDWNFADKWLDKLINFSLVIVSFFSGIVQFQLQLSLRFSLI